MTANRLAHPGDKFDDVATLDRRGHVRRQAKHSSDANRFFDAADITTHRQRVRIDELVRSHRDAGQQQADEYRLCATWRTPTQSKVLVWLEPAAVESSFGDFPTATFRLKAEIIWPEGREPIWEPLRLAVDITRDDFLVFCTRFVLELECPQISSDFAHPGPVENLLLRTLRERIGIGHYPNRNRSPVDVAAGLLWLAQKARTEEARVDVLTIEAHLDLRKDFGRVAQRFPVEAESFVRRDWVQNRLRDLLENGLAQGDDQLLLLTGLPGGGKSWLLERIAEELREAGHLVARHFCYLEPGDPEVQRRITTDVLWGNLIAELIDHAPALRDRHQPIYAADLTALERLLAHAVEVNSTGRVILIVDGLDHIARVRSDAPSLSQAETDVVEQLALLKLPPGVVVVVGSQPGAHLDPLRSRGRDLMLPEWSREAVAALAERRSLREALRGAGLLVPSEWVARPQAEEAAWDELVAALHERSEGNPLYATYLCLDLLNLIPEQHALDWRDRLRELPLFGGRITNYYEFLLNGIEADDSLSGYTAELLGVVDFGLTGEELRSMFPSLGHHLDRCLARLRPILKQTSAQGGSRVYHESFRRFILERLQARGRTLADALQPVLSWLATRDFFFDVKAYRFLLPTLRRAGRLDETLAYFTIDFLARSIAAGQPRPAINANLSLGLAVATQNRDWAKMCRLIHLRLASAIFEEKLQMTEYGRAFAALHGAPALAERLLFDGRPTMLRQEGLLLCELCDEMGQTAPWDVYLTLPDTTRHGSYQEQFRRQEQCAEFRGLLRIEGWEKLRDDLADWLENFARMREASKSADGQPSRQGIDEDYPLSTARDNLRIVGEVVGAEALEELHSLAPTRRPYTSEIAALIDLEAARAYSRAGQNAAAHMAAERAANRQLTLELAAECIELGAEPTTLAPCEPDLLSLAARLNADTRPEPFLVTCWLAATRLLSRKNPAALESAPTLISGAGWYREWLRFAARLACAESRHRTVGVDEGRDQAEALLFAALEDLARHIRPFEGSPRACDLFQIHDHIAGTIARAIALLSSRDALERALPLFQTIACETTTRLDRYYSGPLTPAMLVALLLPYAEQRELQEWLTTRIEEQANAWQERGQYYENHAENEMLRVRALIAAGQRNAAQEAWERAAIYLSAYGYHKDMTLLDLFEPLPLLASLDAERAKELCARIQQLPFVVGIHTDGRDTDQLPIFWFQSLLQVDFIGAVHLLANSLRQDGGQFGWLLDAALRAAINEARRHSHANPLIVAFLDVTRPFPSLSHDDADNTRQEAKRRLQTLERLLADEKKADEQDTTREQEDWGRSCLVNFFAQVEGDGPTYLEDIVETVRQCAQRWNVVLPPQTAVPEVSDSAAGEEHRPISSNALSPLRLLFDWPLFAPNATPLALLAQLRDLESFGSDDAPGAHDRFVNAFGYRLAALIEDGDEDEALRLLRYFAHDGFFSEAVTALAELGEGLERHGHRRAASVAFALAYTRSRGGYWYNALGDSNFETWLLRALELGRDTTFEVLFDEVQGYAERGWFRGLTRKLIECCAHHLDTETAFATWDEACRMLELRLPDTGTLYWTFSHYRPAEVPKWSADEALACLLLARLSHPEFTRRTAALVGLCAMLETLQHILTEPLRAALRSDITQTTATTVLQALWHAEPAPYEVSRGLKDELMVLCDVPHFGLRMTARQLLQRAGIAIVSLPSSTRRTTVVPASAVMNPGEVLSLDWGDRIERLVQLWPDFSLLVASRFKALWDNVPAHKEKMSNIMSAAKSRVEQAIPATPCFWWYREIFEGAFQEVLDGIEPHLWRQGRWTPDMAEGLLQLTTAPVRLHVACWLSRIPRPPLPLLTASLQSQPAQDAPGEESSPLDVPLLPEPSFRLPETVREDSPFDGWVRLALFDEEIFSRAGWSWRRDVDHKIRVVEGAVLLSGPEDELQAGELPFGKSLLLDWRAEPEEVVSYYGYLSRSARGPVVNFTILTDPIGIRPLFALAPTLAAWLGLSPGRWPEMLHLVDETNKIGLVFRHWSLRPIGSDMDEQTPRFRGCDLLLRPDLFARLRDFLRHPLVVWRDCQRSPLSWKDEG